MGAEEESGGGGGGELKPRIEWTPLCEGVDGALKPRTDWIAPRPSSVGEKDEPPTLPPALLRWSLPL